jgi:hypothetical protein
MQVISPRQTKAKGTQFTYSIGADPELFVVDSKGSFRSAHDLVPGMKAQPFRVQAGAIQPDGTSAEFNIDPAQTAAEFSNNIRSVLTDLAKVVAEKAPDCSLRVSPVAMFEAEYFKSLPVEALAFGCTPDYNAWTDGKMTKFPGTTEPFRTGAGHIHVGWSENEDVADPAHVFDCIETVKQLDAVLYPMSLLWDKDRKRRTLYGLMGSFRPKSYGVEYRPLSNAWVADPDLHKWIFLATTRAMQLLDGGCALWKDADLGQAHLGTLRSGKDLLRSELKIHHDILVEEFKFPALPPGYAPV